MKISLVRGAFLNPFELQNFYPLKDQFDITAISSLKLINEKIDLPLVKLPSPTDLPEFPYKYPLLNRIFTDAHYLYNLEKYISGSDIVHTAETYFHYTIQSIKAKQKGIIKKIISTVWETIPHNNEGIHGRKYFKKLSYRNIDYFLAVTNLAKKALIEEGVNPKKISVIPMGVDINLFSPARILRKSKLDLLFIGRFVPDKGIGELLEAFFEIYKKNKNVTLTLIGKGKINNLYQNHPGIIIKQLPYSLINTEYQNADIFILPSRTSKYWQEQFGMVLVEAMASGLPIITTATGAIKEVCSTSAIYAKEKNVKSLLNKINLLLYNQDLRTKLGRTARNRAVELYDSKVISQKIAKLYHHVCKKTTN